MIKTLLDLPLELLESILEMCVLVKTKAADEPIEVSFVNVMSPFFKADNRLLDTSYAFSTIQTLSRVNKRFAQILRGTWTVRDLKSIHQASRESNVSYEFYSDMCIMVTHNIDADKIITLSQSLSKFHPVGIQITTRWDQKTMTKFVQDFTRLLPEIQGLLSIHSIEFTIMPENYSDFPDQSEWIYRCSLFFDLVKRVRAKSTQGEYFYINVARGESFEDEEELYQDEFYNEIYDNFNDDLDYYDDDVDSLNMYDY